MDEALNEARAKVDQILALGVHVLGSEVHATIMLAQVSALCCPCPLRCCCPGRGAGDSTRSVPRRACNWCRSAEATAGPHARPPVFALRQGQR